jgi:hypothetical protein
MRSMYEFIRTLVTAIGAGAKALMYTASLKILKWINRNKYQGIQRPLPWQYDKHWRTMYAERYGSPWNISGMGHPDPDREPMPGRGRIFTPNPRTRPRNLASVFRLPPPRPTSLTPVERPTPTYEQRAQRLLTGPTLPYATDVQRVVEEQNGLKKTMFINVKSGKLTSVAGHPACSVDYPDGRREEIYMRTIVVDGQERQIPGRDERDENGNRLPSMVAYNAEGGIVEYAIHDDEGNIIVHERGVEIYPEKEPRATGHDDIKEPRSIQPRATLSFER